MPKTMVAKAKIESLKRIFKNGQILKNRVNGKKANKVRMEKNTRWNDVKFLLKFRIAG